MRRLLLLMGLAMVMAAMVLASSIPALAAPPELRFSYTNVQGDTGFYPTAQECLQAQSSDIYAISSRCHGQRPFIR